MLIDVIHAGFATLCVRVLCEPPTCPPIPRGSFPWYFNFAPGHVFSNKIVMPPQGKISVICGTRGNGHILQLRFGRHREGVAYGHTWWVTRTLVLPLSRPHTTFEKSSRPTAGSTADRGSSIRYVSACPKTKNVTCVTKTTKNAGDKSSSRGACPLPSEMLISSSLLPMTGDTARRGASTIKIKSCGFHLP